MLGLGCLLYERIASFKAAVNMFAFAVLSSLPAVAQQPSSANQSAVLRNLSFDSYSEPDYRSLLALIMASNADFLDTPAFAWENLAINHIADGPRASFSQDCFQLTQKAANEFDRARIVEMAQRLLKEDLSRASQAPKTRIFRMRQRISVGEYDAANGGLPIRNRENILLLGTPRPIPVKRDTVAPGAGYDGPVQNICKAGFGLIGTQNTLPGSERLPGNPALEIEVVDGVNHLKMSPGDAEAFLARQKSGPNGAFQSRNADLEVLVETEPALFNPKKPGVIAAHVIAARAKDPVSNAVIAVFDVATKAKPSAASPLDAVLFTGKVAALTALRERPEILTETALTNMARQQIFAEQRAYSELIRLTAPTDNNRQNLSYRHIDLDHPAYELAWADTEANAIKRKQLDRVFSGLNTSWDFLNAEPGFNPRLDHYIEAYIFNRDSIRDKEPGAAAQSLAPVFKAHALSVASDIPTHFFTTVDLGTLIYDAKGRALRTEGGAQKELLARSTGGAYLETEVVAKVIYGPFLPPSETGESQWPGASTGSQHPALTWRQTIAMLINGSAETGTGLPYLAFDRQLAFSSIKIDPDIVARVIKNANSTAFGLKARIKFALDGVSLVRRPSKPTQSDLIIRLRLEGVDVLGPSRDDSVLTTVAATEFPSAEALYAAQRSDRAAKQKQDEAANSATTFDVLGITLGMPYAEAKAKALSQLGADVAVLLTKPMGETLKGLPPTTGPDGILGPFVYGALLRANNGKDQLSLFVDPTDTNLPIIGITRLLPFPREFPTVQEIQAALESKYGSLAQQFYNKYVYFYDRQTAFRDAQFCGYYDHPAAAAFYKEGSQSSENGPGLEFRGGNSGTEKCGVGVASNASGNGQIAIRVMSMSVAYALKAKLAATAAAARQKANDDAKANIKLKL